MDLFFNGDVGLCMRGHVAARRGKHHSINVPLKDGMTDTAYEMLFKPVMRRVVDVYQPEVIVFQSGESQSGSQVRLQISL